jgi:hypothetical protein
MSVFKAGVKNLDDFGAESTILRFFLGGWWREGIILGCILKQAQYVLPIP